MAILLIEGLAISSSLLIPPPNFLFIARTILPWAYTRLVSGTISPFCFRASIYFKLAAKKISNGAPFSIWWESMPVEPKDKITFMPVSFSNLPAISFNAKERSEAAATVREFCWAKATGARDKGQGARKKKKKNKQDIQFP